MEGETKNETCFFCNVNHGGKWGICQSCMTQRVAVYDLRLKPGGSADVELSHVHRQVLLFMAKNGAETKYDFSKLKEKDDDELRQNYQRYGEPLADHIRRLIKMGLVNEFPIIGDSRNVLLRLSGSGRNIVTQLDDKKDIVGLIY